MLKKLDYLGIEKYKDHYQADLKGCKKMEKEGFVILKESRAPVWHPNEWCMTVIYRRGSELRITFVFDTDNVAIHRWFGVKLL